MRILLTGTLLALMLPASAQASISFGATFDADNGGVTKLNADGTNLAAFSVVPNSGTVDLVHTGDGFGIVCAGGPGGCIDLDGSTGDAGIIVSKPAFSFGAGDQVNLSFLISGNQRNLAAADTWFGGVSFGGLLNMSNIVLDAGCGSFASANGAYNGLFVGAGFCPTFGNTPFALRTLSFTAGQSGTLHLLFGDAVGADNIGAILDNVVLRVESPAVPEPATWMMMIAGFAMVGRAMRRRRPVARVTYA